MYFGDWLRTSEIKHTFYLSYSSEDKGFPKRIGEAVEKNGQIQKISETVVMIETLEPKGPTVKRIRKALTDQDDVILLFPHHKIIGHQRLTPWGVDPEE